ncbi:hypothetical protein [Sphingomonas sp. CCH5-D11]|uniref:hypothetical protein n=1 Tax=Sphingomonas sp. CCH5-D11 TaxID=1768786 RepID=UPI00082C2334|nr:hypothetical protein [Sphingomonas sp. CCH5-D11]
MANVSVALAILLQTSITPPSAMPVSATDETPVCRRIEVTGSLARKERVCKTKAEWRAAEDSGNSRARAIVDYSTGRPSGQ